MHVQCGTVEMQQLAIKVGNCYALVEVFDDRLKLGLALVQRLLRPLPVGVFIAQRFVSGVQGVLPLLNNRKHLVESISELANFVPTVHFSAHGKILMIGNGFGGLGQKQDGLRDLFLQRFGNEIRDREDNPQYHHGDANGVPKPPLHDVSRIEFEVERAQLLVILKHRLETK